MKKALAALQPCVALFLIAVSIAAQTTGVARPLRSVATPEQMVRDFVAAFNAHDIDAMLALVTDDLEWLNIDGRKITAEADGKPSLRTSMTSYFRSCPTCRSEVSQITTAGSRITALEVATWEANGRPKSQRSLSVYEFREGRIRRVYYFPSEP